MLRDSIDAVSKAIVETGIAFERLYIETMPSEFLRPSFFINMVTNASDHLNASMYQNTITWQIVYFAKLNTKGQADPFEQLEVADKVKRKLMNDMVITGPSGTVYRIEDVTGEPRDNEVYLFVRIYADATRPKEQYELIQTVDLKEE